MKTTLFLMALLASSATFSQTFDCALRVDFNEATPLVQTSFADDDPEENSELYELLLDDGVYAAATYLPFQNGLDLFVKKGDVKVLTNFDQDSDEYANVDLFIGETTYRLYCRKK